MDPFAQFWKADPPQPYTDITILLDRSASMSKLAEAVVDGFNEQFAKVQAAPGDNRWTLVQFDDHDSARGAGENFPQVLFDQQPEAAIPKLTHPPRYGQLSGSVQADQLVHQTMTALQADQQPVFFCPRGNTALIDAFCEVIDRTEARTSGMEHVKVVVGVFTDGEENSSRRHSNAGLRERIARTQTLKGWDYLYFGANQDSFHQTSKIGIGGVATSGHLPPGASYTNDYVGTPVGMRQAIASGMCGMFEIASGSITSGRVAATNINVSVAIR